MNTPWPFVGRDAELRQALAAVAGSRPGGVVLAGPAYVGRTRFLDRVAGTLGTSRPVHRVVAARGSRSLPFAALGALAPSDPGAPAGWHDELRGKLGNDPVLMVDDAQWLDDASAQLVVEATRAGSVTPVLALRSGPRPHDGITALWKDQVLTRIDIGPLDRGACDAIVGHVLASPVAEPARQQLWDLSRGYPLVLREYLLGGVASGALAEEGGLWTVTGELAPPPRYVDVVRGALRSFGPERTEVIRLVVIGEPLEAAILDRLVPAEAVAAVERTGMLDYDSVTRRYRMAVPGVRMAARRALEEATIRDVSRRLVSAVEGRQLADDDLVRLATWRLDAGDGDHPQLFVRAAERTAVTFEPALTERFARAALPGGGVTARVLLANAAVAQERVAEGERLLAEAVGLATTDEERGQVVDALARLWFFQLGRLRDGVELLERTCRELPLGPVRDGLTATRAFLASLEGDVDRAVELSAEVLDLPQVTAPVRAAAAMAAGFACVLRGDLEAAGRHSREGLALPAPAVERQQPLARPLLDLIAIGADTYAGRLGAAARRGRARYLEALEQGSDEVSGLYAAQLASACLHRGEVDEAARLSNEARRLLSGSDALATRDLAGSVGARAHAEAGRVAEAQDFLDEIARRRPYRDLRSHLLEEWAQASIAAARGELEHAAELSRRAAERARARLHLTRAVFVAHQAVRYGYPERVRGLLEELGSAVDGPLAPALAAHARALADRDVPGLERVGDRLAELGAWLWGAEALGQGARTAAAAGDPRRARLLRARAGTLLERCPGARTPATQGLDAPPLTRREHEIALLAAGGATSREVAERLQVSVRTVDNHLASVYRKLGVRGRDRLPAALGLR
jgi:DNA-binding CsgD family transcriptional regulator